MVEEQVAGHEHEVALLGESDELVHLRCSHRRRLLDEDVLVRRQRAAREIEMRRDRRRDHDRVELGVGDQLVDIAGQPRVGIAAGEGLAHGGIRVAEPDEVGELVEVAREVRPPVAEAGEADGGSAGGPGGGLGRHEHARQGRSIAQLRAAERPPWVAGRAIYNFQTLSERRPSVRVALRRSTTSCASSTSLS